VKKCICVLVNILRFPPLRTYPRRAVQKKPLPKEAEAYEWNGNTAVYESPPCRSQVVTVTLEQAGLLTPNHRAAASSRKISSDHMQLHSLIQRRDRVGFAPTSLWILTEPVRLCGFV